MARRPSPLDLAVATQPVSTVQASVAHQQPPANVQVARRPPSRQGKRSVMFWLDQDAFRQLQLLSVDQDETIQALMEEAFDLLLRHHGKARTGRIETI